MVHSSEAAMERGQRFGPYELVRKLGAGGMGVVYLARDTRNGARVALKRLTNLDAAAPLRLKNEFRAVAHLAHPNLVSLHELSSDGESWFFTMEYIEGSDLASLMRRSISSSFPVVSPRRSTCRP